MDPAQFLRENVWLLQVGQVDWDFDHKVLGKKKSELWDEI
jgi:hypothetical protein